MEESTKFPAGDYSSDLVTEIELPSLYRTLKALDGNLAELENEWEEWEQEPDLAIGFDSWFNPLKETSIGLGFVAMQEFMSSARKELGKEKKGSFSHGRTIQPGLFIAEAINYAGNYFKHRDDWENIEDQKERRKQKEKAIEAFRKMAITSLDADDYPLLQLFGKISTVSPPSLTSFIEDLETWYKELSR